MIECGRDAWRLTMVEVVFCFWVSMAGAQVLDETNAALLCGPKTIAECEAARELSEQRKMRAWPCF
jgi:hypothetical protein